MLNVPVHPLHFAVLALAFAPVAFSQANTGSIKGTVVDPSAAAMPGVQVLVTNTATGEKRTVTTNELGQYVFPALLPGTYAVAAEKTGFKRTVQDNIRVDVQQVVRVDILLNVGSVSESVEVNAETTMLQPSTSSLGQVVDNKQILDLPLNGRNTLALVSLTTGVQPLGGFGGVPAVGNAYGQGNFSVSGGPGLSTEVIIDGAPVNASLFNAPAFVPSVDAVEEFKVQTNMFSADFGRTGGGVVNVVMKSGTNAFHGDAYEFFRNRVLDANNFFNNASGRAIPGYTFNMFGGTLGGPVVLPKVYNGKDHSFFFVSYEGFRQSQGLTVLTTVPSALQRTGDFSQTLNSAGQLVGIYDPLSTTPGPNGTYTRIPFPNNRIPADRIDAVAAKMMTFYPQPNLPGNPVTGVNDFISNAGATNTSDQINTRLDHQFSSGQHLYGRYSINTAHRGAANIFHNPFGGVNPTGGNVPILIRGQQFVMHDTITASPTSVVDLSYGVIRQFVFKEPLSFGSPLTDLGFPASFDSQLPEKYYPNFSITNFYGLTGSNGDLIRRGDYTHSFQGSVTKIHSRHTVKAGAEYRLLRANDYQPPAALSFGFSPGFTQQDPRKVAPNSGVALASFLLGYASSGSHNIAPAMALQNQYFAAYVQDDIRITPKLTLNLGLRQDLETPRTERYNRTNWFDFSASSPLAGRVGIPNMRGGLVFAGVDGNSRGQQILDTNNFAPRVGFAYSLNDKTVLRGGYGIFFMPLDGTGIGTALGNGGFASSTSMVTTLDSALTPHDVLANPFPGGLNFPPGSSQGLNTLVGQGLTVIDHNNRVGYSQEFNVNLQRDLPGNLLLDLAYAGSHAVKLPQFWEQDQLSPTYYNLAGQLLDQVTNPFLGVVGLGPFASPTLARNQLLKPYPQFLSVSSLEFAGDSIYHSFQLKLQRRFNDGLGFQVSYTISKDIGDVAPLVSWLGDSTPGIQNNYDRRAERSLIATDVPQRLVVNFTYELPFGRGKHFGGHWNRAVDMVAGGWQINGITTAQSGLPLNIGLNQSNPFGGSRPNSTGQSAALSSDKRTLSRWFNTSVFTQPPAYSFGNVARTLPDVRGYNTRNFDVSLFKILNLTEQLHLQLRAEAFNVFNRTRFGTPNTSFGSPAFGQISSAGDPRLMQLALKLIF